MDQFQWIVISVALFLLIIILIIVGMIMRKATSSSVYPPVQQPCPDLWTSDISGNCYYIGQNYGSAFSKSNGNLIYSGPSDYPVYTYNKNTWYNANGTVINQPSFLSTIPNNIPNNFAVLNTKDPSWKKNGNVLCNQKSFANNSNIYWDGVSNVNQC